MEKLVLAIEIGIKLFSLKESIASNTLPYTWQTDKCTHGALSFFNWISSPEGSDSVKRAMLQRGYTYKNHALIIGDSFMFEYVFTKDYTEYRGQGKTDNEALLKAVMEIIKNEQR
jgi:hypothetical protein